MHSAFQRGFEVDKDFCTRKGSFICRVPEVSRGASAHKRLSVRWLTFTYSRQVKLYGKHFWEKV